LEQLFSMRSADWSRRPEKRSFNGAWTHYIDGNPIRSKIQRQATAKANDRSFYHSINCPILTTQRHAAPHANNPPVALRFHTRSKGLNNLKRCPILNFIQRLHFI